MENRKEEIIAKIMKKMEEMSDDEFQDFLAFIETI